MNLLKSVAILFLVLGSIVVIGGGLTLIFPNNSYFLVMREFITSGMLFMSVALNFALLSDGRKIKGLN